MADELLDIAHGNPRLAAELERMLSALAKSESAVLREMAQGVLDGGSLREAATSSAYGEDVSAAFGEFWDRYQTMTPEERTELEDTGRRLLDEYAVEPTEDVITSLGIATTSEQQ